LFFYQLQSRKAEQIASNPYASAAFLWKQLHRQVLLEGKIEFVHERKVKPILHKTKRAQIATHASLQSSPLASREELEDAFAITNNLGEKSPCPKIGEVIALCSSS